MNTMQQSADALFQSWRAAFPGVAEETLNPYFDAWQSLERQRAAMQATLAKTSLLPGAAGKLSKAARRLEYDVPYRIVVLGETGAGKSTLINALLGQNRLVTGAGGAITGIPVYVHPAAPGEEERVLVTYRTNDDFAALIQGIGRTNAVDLPLTRTELANVYEERISEATASDPEGRQRLLDATVDVLETWQRLESRGLLGKVQPYDPVEHREVLQQLMEEKSAVNALGSDNRVIAGIARMEYYVRMDGAGLSDDTLPANVVLIDTPGIGAQTIRHQEILRQEVVDADAVILVVGAKRPEEKSASMAYLLEQSLLGSFSPEQKERFAQKVFLVVNQFDSIQTSDDHRRLHESVESLSSIIAPGFSARHVYSTADPRYFETVAQLAALAQQKRQQGTLPDTLDGLYRGRLEQLLSDEERSTAHVETTALAKSGVSALRAALHGFLGTKRLALSLDEAGVLLGQVPVDAESETFDFFNLYGLTLDDSMSLDTLSERNTRQLCNKQLEHDRDVLLASCNAMLERAQQWRASSEYHQSLTEKINQVCNHLDQQMEAWVGDELPRHVVMTLDPVAGPTHMEMAINSFLIVAEQRLRNLAEDEAHLLADYYLGQFRDLIKSHRIYDAIVEKSYEQPYVVKRVHPVASLQKVQGEIASEFVDICRWVLIYELLRNPILGPQDEPNLQIPRIAKEVAMQLAEVALAVSITAVSPGATTGIKAAGSVFMNILGRSGGQKPSEEKPQSRAVPDPEDQKQEQKRATDYNKLREAIESALAKRNMTNLQHTITNELSKRNKLAVSKSLPYLDMLFFYQIDKFHQEYEAQVAALYHEHVDQVADRNTSIREILVRRNDVTLLQAGELLRVLRELRQLV